MRSYEEELARAKAHAERERQKQELHDIKHSNDKKRPLAFSKMALIFIVANCTVIEVYSMFVMYRFMDLSALTTLIATIVGECISLCVYLIKSAIENKGIVVSQMEREQDRIDAENGFVRNSNGGLIKTEKSQEEKMDDMLDSMDDGAVG